MATLGSMTCRNTPAARSTSIHGFWVRDRTEDNVVRLLAYDIALTQQQQIGQMAGWLAHWQLPQTGSDPPMSWTSSESSMTSHDMGDGTSAGAAMPGMATAADIDRLTAATDRDAETLYLDLMIAHHRGGVMMAEAIGAQSSDPVVTGLAHTIVASQQAEIEAMSAMLAERAAAP